MSTLLEYLKTPQNIAVVISCAFLICQIIGELLEFKGKVVPEIMKIRKYFARKKREREALARMPELIDKCNNMPDIVSALADARKMLEEVNLHYSSDNIAKRDTWIHSVDQKLAASDQWMKQLDEKMDRNNADTLAIMIDNQRNAIIDFAAYVVNENNPVTREQYTRFFKIYEEYEDRISASGLTNGEVDIAYRIAKESYEQHLKNHTFVENLRGYDI